MFQLPLISGSSESVNKSAGNDYGMYVRFQLPLISGSSELLIPDGDGERMEFQLPLISGSSELVVLWRRYVFRWVSVASYQRLFGMRYSPFLRVYP